MMARNWCLPTRESHACWRMKPWNMAMITRAKSSASMWEGISSRSWHWVTIRASSFRGSSTPLRTVFRISGLRSASA